jgi:hypothetical protein
MTSYVLCAGVTAAQVSPVGVLGGGRIPSGSQAVFIQGGGGGQLSPAVNQVFEVTVASNNNSGAPTATVQPIVSNDGINWQNYGSAITITGGPSPNSGNASGSAPWPFYSAVVTALSGTGAAVSCTMNA